MTKVQEIMNKIEEMKAEAKELKTAKEINDKISEIEDMKAQLKVAEMEEADEKAEIENKIKEGKMKNLNNEGMDDKMENKIDGVKVFAKALRRESLTEVENALVTGGSNGENNIIPVDVRTKINELARQYKSARELVGYMPTSTLSGSFVYEDLSTMGELTNFTDGSNVPTAGDAKFNTVPYALKEYGGILEVSNVLLQNETGGLVDYIGNWFNKKRIRTENKKIFETLKAGKSAKAIADWKALKKSINIDLDPMIAGNTVIVTNQNGFDVLDSAVDTNGRPILQPNPINSTERLFMGYPVHIFSNAELPTTGSTAKKAPIFYGDLSAGCTFIDRNNYEFKTSSEAGFDTNKTKIRVIELIDCVQADKDAYMVGELTIA